MHFFNYARMATLLAGTLAAAAAQNPTLNPLVSFNGSNGKNPACVLVSDPTGALYGTALGGSSGYGVVYKLTPISNSSWVQTVLYNFTGKTDGAEPGTGLIFDTGGALYGTMFAGGAYNYGGIFQLKPPPMPGGTWTENVLYSFQGRQYGSNPQAPLVFGPSGVLYGVSAGGPTGYGEVFQLTPGANGSPWTLAVLHQFTGGGDGATPAGGLLLGTSGTLYGMTGIGGAFNSGTVYELLPPSQQGGAWTEKVIYSFKANRGDGVFPFGGLAGSTNGTLYGSTTAGGNSGAGTVFALKPPSVSGGAWTESILYSFRGGSDGINPVGTLVFGNTGSLYGSTAYGGSQNKGTLFKLTPNTTGPWTESVLHSFTGATDGQNPQSGVIFGKNSDLYGTTAYGGSSNIGTVYQLTL